MIDPTSSWDSTRVPNETRFIAADKNDSSRSENKDIIVTIMDESDVKHKYQNYLIKLNFHVSIEDFIKFISLYVLETLFEDK